MSKEKEQTKKKVELPTTVEELYKDKSDEELQKLMYSYLTGDSGEQNQVTYDMYNELVRRTGEGEEIEYPGSEEGEDNEEETEDEQDEINSEPEEVVSDHDNRSSSKKEVKTEKKESKESEKE